VHIVKFIAFQSFTLIRDDVLRLAKHYFLQNQRKYLYFSAFPNFRKMGNFAASIELPKAKTVSALGGFTP